MSALFKIMLISRVALMPKVTALVKLTKSLTTEAITKAIRCSLSVAKKLTGRQLRWELARYLSAISRTAYLSHANAKRITRIWHLECLKCGKTPGTLRECWLDIKQAIPKVEFPAGVCLESLYKKARGEGIERLESLVHVLAKYRETFALSSNALAGVFGVHQTTISRWLLILVDKGVLEVTQDDSFAGAAAREYRLKPLEKQAFKGNALHALIGDAPRIVERSNDAYDYGEKAVLRVNLAEQSLVGVSDVRDGNTVFERKGWEDGTGVEK